MQTTALVNPGDVVTYVDEYARAHKAIVTAVHDGQRDASQPWGANAKPDAQPMELARFSVNLAYVSSDTSRSDGHGRQIERRSSVCHQANQAAHGNYWKLPSE